VVEWCLYRVDWRRSVAFAIVSRFSLTRLSVVSWCIEYVRSLMAFNTIGKEMSVEALVDRSATSGCR